MQRIWNIAQPSHALQEELSRKLGISRILATLLINRKIATPEDAERFLRPSLTSLFDPYQMPDMIQAVARIKQAIDRKEKIFLYGDYDVDGLTSLALLESQFAKLGVKTSHYIPHRVKEGYGLNKEAIAHIEKLKTDLVITVDCGISNFKEAEELKRHGIDLVITDHHEVSDERIPQSVAAVDPKRHGSCYPFRELAGVGVAYKLAQCLMDDFCEDDLDLVLLGTVADMVPLVSENRTLVKQGLLNFHKTKRPGLRALLEATSIKAKPITTTAISFILAPRINASGRVDSAHTSLELLLTQSKERGQELAQVLSKHNQERQKFERQIMEEATDIIGREVNFKDHNVIVLAREGWHPGVLGIVASKIMDRFYRPTVVISVKDGLCKGSCRSIKNFHIFDALWDSKDLLESFGGHSHAAGILISREKISEFKNRINHVAKQKLLLEDLLPSLDVDMEVSFADVTIDVVRDIENLAPFGNGNPEPVLFTRGLRLKGAPQVYSRDTLKFWCTDGHATHSVVGFGMGSLSQALVEAGTFDLIYTPAADGWNGEDAIQLEMRDIRFFPR